MSENYIINSTKSSLNTNPQSTEISIGEEDLKSNQSSNSVDGTAPSNNKELEKNPVTKQKIAAIIGVVCGCIILVFGVLSFSGTLYTSYGTAGESNIEETSYCWYGGDAYTGIQQAAADASTNAGIAASNVQITNFILNRIITALGKILGLVLVSMGLMTICKYLYKLFSMGKPVHLNEKLKEEELAETIAVTAS